MALLTKVRFKIMRNIGNSFVRLGQFQDAIASYEQARAHLLLTVYYFTNDS